MKNGLKQRLNDFIKSYKGEVVPHDTIKQLCKTWGYRESNAERRLRMSESPNIERLMKNGAIIGYRYQEAPTTPNLSPASDYCRNCIDYALHGKHSSYCILMREKTKTNDNLSSV